MTDEQIKHMANRFLSWRLPDDFSPDNGISFDPVASKGTKYETRRQPVGTNLFTATQAEAMARFLVEDMPNPHEEAAASTAKAIAQARAALHDAELARDRSKNAMDAGSFGGRNRTAQAQRTVDQMRANLARLEAAETQP